jgi:Protein of unknown function (DUF3025)
LIELIPAALRAHAAFAPYIYASLAETIVGWAPRAHQTAAKQPVQQCRTPVGRGCPPYEDGTSGNPHPFAGEGPIPRFIPPPARALSAIDFERRVVEHNELIVRPGSLHDLLNALVWRTFPKTKRAISEVHVALGVNKDGKTRPRRRDVLTLFDESGIIILSENDALRAMNRQHQWHELFVTHRAVFIQQARPILFGHGAMEQIGNQLPHVHRGLTVKALWLPLPVTTPLAELDEYLAERIINGERLNAQERSIPMPVLGLPGWFAENESPDCYDDGSVFRPLRPKIQ